MNVLNKGFVNLEDHMGGDLEVVNSARVSFNSRRYQMMEEDEKLIGFLMRNKHGTPFEHNSFMFHVKAPIFVFREWHRHRIASINEWSARYSKLEPEFYIPEPHDVRSQHGKPGKYTFAHIGTPTDVEFISDLERSSFEAYEQYERYLERGVAKEQARCFLPVNIYSEMFWTVNARSLMNFLELRTHPTAMYEIRAYANAILGIWREKMPVTAEAFEANGRIAP